MPHSPDLLRDAEVLRKLLSECLRRVDRLERRLSVEALQHEDGPAAAPLTDPFERALPEGDRGRATGTVPPDAPPPRTSLHPPFTDSDQTIRTVHVSPGSRLEPDELLGPHAEPIAPRSSGDQPSHRPDTETTPPSGDGTLDPFALLDVSVPSPEPLDVEIRRGMNALLGGLDVSTPNGE